MPSFQFRSGSHIYPAYCAACDCNDLPSTGIDYLADSQLALGRGGDTCPGPHPSNLKYILGVDMVDIRACTAIHGFIVEPFAGISTIGYNYQSSTIPAATGHLAYTPQWVFTDGTEAYPAYCCDCDAGHLPATIQILANAQLCAGPGGDNCPSCNERLLVMDRDAANRISQYTKWLVVPTSEAPSLTPPPEAPNAPDLCLQCFVPPNTQYDTNAIAHITESLCKGRGTIPKGTKS